MASTISRSVGEGDVRRPRISLAPAYAASAGPEAADLAGLAGLHLDDWQQEFLTASLGEDAEGRWAAMECALVVPRQNGKNAVLLARELAGLFLLEEGDLIHSAQQQDTSVEQYGKLRALIEGCPELSRRVAKMPAGKGTEGIYLKRDPVSGRAPRLMFRTRTGTGGLGFSADFIAFDEALILPEMFHGHLMPVLSARPNPQIWYTSSAVDQQRHEHGVVLARIRERGVAGTDSSLVYAEWSADVDRLDLLTRELARNPRLRREANPAYEYRVSERYVDQEETKLDLRSFGNMRLNVGDWPDTDEDSGRVIPQEIWNACADSSSKITRAHTFALDVDPLQKWATLAAAGERDDGLWHVMVVEHAAGVGWVTAACKEWLGRYSDARLVVDPRGDLAELVRELADAGIQPVETAAHDVKTACGGFLKAVGEKQLRYMPPQPELEAAVAAARTRPLLDAWKWDRRSAGAVITPLIAVTLALWGARTQGVPEVYSLAEVVERLRREKAEEPHAVQAPAGVPRAGFISLEEFHGVR